MTDFLLWLAAHGFASFAVGAFVGYAAAVLVGRRKGGV